MDLRRWGRMDSQQDILQQFIRYIQLEKNFSVHTVREYENDVEQFLAFLNSEGVQRFEDVEYMHARIYVTQLYDAKLARTTISRKISAVRTFFRFLNRDFAIDDAPFRSLYHPKKEERLPSFFYEQELQQLFEANEGDDPKALRNIAILELLYATGIRVSECVSLELGQVDLDYSIIRVMGKGRKERIVPFGQFAHDALTRYIQIARPVLVKQHNHKKMFVNLRGTELSDRGVRHILKDMMKNAELHSNIYPHMLRHTFATHLLNNGADMRTVQELLGHSHLASTQVYTHVTKEHLRATYMNAHPRA